ncbi:hypothetical protein BJ973_004402 [Actinoplanes tereljensis]|uniref:Uncharacterized protein n=1 Tax=Paractinoplanes tereljensis TaxID=571912 RepID=A0A919NU35_9ACTN|nr:hypothetical protein [Actinoplanes tereljensis]GIF23792.1 hypothetical protein Ate02nite_65220 [Actinoplanes tereljensis]
MPDTLYDFTKCERRAAARAYRQLPLRDRRDAFRQASHGQPHPDPAVAAEEGARLPHLRRPDGLGERSCCE